MIEGKVYATKKIIFKIENQATIFESYIINLQKQLIGLFKDVFLIFERNINLESEKISLVFFIYT